MTKTLEFALGLSALLALAGCYNTNSLTNGGLVCGKDGSCPSGFRCVSDGPVGTAGHCWKNGTGPDAGAASDATGATADAQPVAACTAAQATPPYGPFAVCSANRPIPNSTCDPVCQAGCPCNHRCILNDQTNSSFDCEASAPPANTVFKNPLEACNGSDTELCAPGSVCIPDNLCGNLCYKLCRTDEDCGGNSRCTTSTIVVGDQPVSNVLFCSPPIETCNPVGAAACSPARTDFNCVFLAGLTGIGNTDNTVCDCSTLHYNALGTSCSPTPDDCQPGLVCVNGTCHAVCNLSGTTAGCSACTAIYGSKSYGYCR